MEITQEEREALDTKHGGIVVVGTVFGDFAFRAVNEAEYKKFNAAIEQGPEAKVEAHKTVCVSTLVWPSGADGAPNRDLLRECIGKRPGLIHSLATHVMVHSGVTAEAARKK